MYARRNEADDYSTRRFTKVNIIRIIEENARRLRPCWKTECSILLLSIREIANVTAEKLSISWLLFIFN